MTAIADRQRKMKAILMTANVTAIADRRSKMRAIATTANVTAIADRQRKMKAIDKNAQPTVFSRLAATPTETHPSGVRSTFLSYRSIWVKRLPPPMMRTKLKTM